MSFFLLSFLEFMNEKASKPDKFLDWAGLSSLLLLFELNGLNFVKLFREWEKLFSELLSNIDEFKLPAYLEFILLESAPSALTKCIG